MESPSISSFKTDFTSDGMSSRQTEVSSFAETVFTSSTYHQTLLDGFQVLRRDSALCDVTLIAGDEQFNVHRVLLAACSPYFRELFTKDKSAPICKPLPRAQSNNSLNGTLTDPEDPEKINDGKNEIENKNDNDDKDNQGNLKSDLNSEKKSSFKSSSTKLSRKSSKKLAKSKSTASIPQKYTWFSETIELRGVTSEGLKHIVDFLYTGKIPISMGSVQNILVVARHMQITPVLDFCSEFLTTAIDVHTCTDIVHIAEVFGMPKLEEKGYQYIFDRFPEFMKSPQLQKLTFENICQILDSDDLKAMSEMDIFAATLKWVMYDQARHSFIRKLMEKIRFPLMPPRDLMVHVNVVDFMRAKCNDLLLEASSYHMLPHSQPIIPSPRCRVRSVEQRLVVVGGADNTDEVSNQLKVFNPELTAYTLLPNMTTGVHSHCICVLNNFLYVIGGQRSFEERGKTATDEVARFDPRFNTWMKIAPMNEKRAGFSVTVIPSFNRIYAVGGVNSVGRLSSVECYCVEEDRWKYVASTQHAICDHAGGTFRDKMFISGGFADGQFSDSMLCYNPKHDIWEKRTGMQTARGWHQMITHKEKIFIIGGNSGINKRQDVIETEMYAPDFDQWTTVAPLPMGQSEAGATIFRNKIYVVGGYCWSARRCVKIIQTYNITKDEWERVGNLPRGLAGLRLCSLTLPHHLIR